MTADTAAETRRRIRAAMERRDHAAVVSLLTPDVAFHSPIISTAFEGRQAVGDVIAGVIDTFGDLHYTAEASEGDLQILSFRARVRGRDIEAVDLLRVNDAGLVYDITVLIRPLAGLATVAAVLAPYVARGRTRALLLRAFATPIAALLTLIEPLIPRLIHTRTHTHTSQEQ